MIIVGKYLEFLFYARWIKLKVSINKTKCIQKKQGSDYCRKKFPQSSQIPLAQKKIKAAKLQLFSSIWNFFSMQLYFFIHVDLSKLVWIFKVSSLML